MYNITDYIIEKLKISKGTSTTDVPWDDFIDLLCKACHKHQLKQGTRWFLLSEFKRFEKTPDDEMPHDKINGTRCYAVAIQSGIVSRKEGKMHIRLYDESTSESVIMMVDEKGFLEVFREEDLEQLYTELKDGKF